MMIFDIEILKSILMNEYGDKYNKLMKNIKFNPIVSYTTRPMRDSETEGLEHYFITNDEADKLLSTNDTLAYTEINNYKYFTLKEQLKDQNVYIIDPTGIEDISNRYPDIEKVIIYVSSNYQNRKYRYISRSKECTEEDFEKRNEAEDKQFTIFERKLHNYDNIHTIVNNSPYILSAVSSAVEVIMDTYNPNVLYCVVGRTSSGKDTITRYLCKLFNDYG